MKDKKFSVIIPTYNRPGQLAACLEKLGKQNVPVNSFEVIVVDDGGRPNLDTKMFPVREGLDLKIITQENMGPAQARNAGAHKAEGEYLLFTDDDCQADPNWAKLLVEQLDKSPDKLVGGKSINGLPDNPFSEASQLLNSYVYSYYNQKDLKIKFFASNNMAIAKNDFIAIGGFSNNYTVYVSEDRDFCDRWILAGKGMEYVSNAFVMHCHDMGFFFFFKQHFNYGKGARLFHLERINRNQPIPNIEPVSFYIDMLAFPFGKVNVFHAAFLSLLLGTTQFAHTLGYFWERFVARTI